MATLYPSPRCWQAANYCQHLVMCLHCLVLQGSITQNVFFSSHYSWYPQKKKSPSMQNCMQVWKKKCSKCTMAGNSRTALKLSSNFPDHSQRGVRIAENTFFFLSHKLQKVKCTQDIFASVKPPQSSVCY